MKERLDILLVKRGLAPSREKAKAMIMEGNVFVENQREDKAGTSIPENAKIEIKGNTLKDKYPLCDTGGYWGTTGFCFGGCILYFSV